MYKIVKEDKVLDFFYEGLKSCLFSLCISECKLILSPLKSPIRKSFKIINIVCKLWCVMSLYVCIFYFSEESIPRVCKLSEGFYGWSRKRRTSDWYVFLFYKLYAFEFITKWISFEIKGLILVTVSFSMKVFSNIPVSHTL